MIETLMTYEDWTREYKLREEKRRKEVAHKLAQKIAGLLLLCISLLGSLMLMDITPLFILVPLSLVLIFSNKQILM